MGVKACTHVDTKSARAARVLECATRVHDVFKSRLLEILLLLLLLLIFQKRRLNLHFFSSTFHSSTFHSGSGFEFFHLSRRLSHFWGSIVICIEKTPLRRSFDGSGTAETA